MKSGLEGRNNWTPRNRKPLSNRVSMKSGLEGRNNDPEIRTPEGIGWRVSMKSGLEGRNNLCKPYWLKN